MKTRGIELLEGGAILLAPGRACPDPLWARLKHAIQRAGLVDAYKADFSTSRAKMLEDKQSAWEAPLAVEERHEAALFRRWAERVMGPQARWPWEAGWTEDEVDAYLTQPDARAA